MTTFNYPTIDEEFRVLLESSSLSALKSLETILAYWAPGQDRDADFSPAVALACKILEIELRSKLFAPLRSQVSDQAQRAVPPIFGHGQQKSYGLRQFLEGGKPPGLGEIVAVLRYLAHVGSREDGDAYCQMKYYLRRTYSRPYYFWGKERLAERIGSALAEYRNPSVHTRSIRRGEMDGFLERAFGGNSRLGFVNSALKCMRPAGTAW